MSLNSNQISLSPEQLFPYFSSLKTLTGFSNRQSNVEIEKQIEKLFYVSQTGDYSLRKIRYITMVSNTFYFIIRVAQFACLIIHLQLPIICFIV